MKKAKALVLGLVVLLAGSSVLAAQSFGGGIKGGLGLASMTGDVATDSKSRTGFAAGAFLTIGINDLFSIQPEILYAQKGSRYEETFEGQLYAETLAVDYLEIPILAKLTFTMPGGVKPNVYFGPAVSFKVSSKYKWDWNGQSGTEPVEEGFLKSTDFGLAFGGGLEYKLGSGKFLVDLRYTLGLTNISDVSGDTVKNSTFMILIGYGF